MANHIIHRINMEIEAPDQQSARIFRDRASLILKNDILPALEKYFDTLGWKEEVLRLNQLDIDLGDLTHEHFENELLQKVLDQIRQQLDKKAPAYTSHDPLEEAPLQLSREEKKFETFLHFLSTGQLPWWSSSADARKMTELLPVLFSVQNKDWQQRLKELLKNEPRAVHRLLLQLPEKIIVTTIIYILPAKLQNRPTIKREIRQAIRHYAKHGTLSLPGISTTPLHRTDSQTTTREGEIPETIFRPSPEEEGLYTGHAGLILLHPFLESFLEETGWVKEKKFISYEARINAAHLLNYLVTGEENPMEPEMIFEKYLCGIDLEEPIPGRFAVDEKMKMECEKLLRAVIGHWKVLKRTSPAGLRETFLKREGKLLLNDIQHQLVVENKSTDILLSRLPWGYQVVKLPWLVVPLLVDWTH